MSKATKTRGKTAGAAGACASPRRRRAHDSARCRSLSLVIEHIGEGVVILNADLRTVRVNPAFTKITGYSRADVRGLRPAFIKNLRRAPGLYRAMREAMAAGVRWEGDFYDFRKTAQGKKETYALHLSVAPIGGPAARKKPARRPAAARGSRQYVAVLSDVTERKAAEENAIRQATFDDLTGLPNRRLFQERLRQEMASASRNGSQVAIIFLDLDGFKEVNDTLGHDVGDRMLGEAARRLKGAVRMEDTVARLGGDEFTIVMPSADANIASCVAQRVLDELAAPFTIESHELFVSASIGVTVYPDDGTDQDELMRNADQAMYRAKADGKANWQFYRPDHGIGVRERMAIRNGLPNAIKRKELALHYQPKLDLKTQRLAGVEALLRWKSPELGAVSPAKFVPVMEESNMVVDVGRWIIDQACRQHLDWMARGLPGIRIAVNLSARQLREPSFVDHFVGILEDAGVGSDAIEVEITESMLMDDRERAATTLGKLRDLGIKIAMDDFGTGYSSLSYLKSFPIDVIKIDRSFVTDMTKDPEDAALIKTIISMGFALDRLIVAEGVESPEQASMLRDLSCSQAQGYLIAAPMPADDLVQYLAGHPTMLGTSTAAPGRVAAAAGH